MESSNHPHYYNDESFSYPAFWKGREYEHLAEVLAIHTLLKGRHFEAIADVGGGFGRLTDVLHEFGPNITLVEPAGVQRNLVPQFVQSPIEVIDGDAEHTGLPDGSCDLVVMVRVAHHLRHPKPSFRECWRVLRPDGLLLLEFANSANFKARARNRFGPMLLSPIDMGSIQTGIPFLNHHPRSIKQMLREEGFAIIEELSVSNFRSMFLKRILSSETLLKLEKLVQRPLGRIHFGPSLFLLAKKV